MKRRRAARSETDHEVGATLRGRAEQRLEKRRSKRASGGKADPPKDDPRRLVHDLEVHQVELEIQNEELRATRLEAEAAAARFAELYEFAPMGYATLRADGSIHAINLAGAGLLGSPRSRLVGQRLATFVRPDDRRAFAGFLGETLASDEQHSRTREFTLANGEKTIQARLTAALLRRPDPEILLALEDVSELKRHEQERAELLRVAQDARAHAEEANRAKDDFLATLSHELRNPLAPISNSVYILERSEAPTEQARRAAAVIRRQVTHLSRLIDDLLDVERITRGKITLVRRPVDLNGLAHSTIEDLRSIFDDCGIVLELVPAAAPTYVEGDWDRLAQVLGNLLQNAAKFSKPGGTTRVVVAQDPRECVGLLRVLDDGVGMAPEMLSRLFQPFVQADRTLDRSKGGLGLGMALAKDLVEMHGGHIRAHSAGLGKGSEFEVRLPLAPGEASERGPRRGSGSHRSRRVLIIEDNVDAADSLRELLEMHGHVVGVAYDGPGGLAMAHETKPEIVLCDVGLPGMDGYAVARAIRADTALDGVFLIALSGYAQPEDVRRATESGFQLHVAKPPDPEQLQSLFDEVPPARA